LDSPISISHQSLLGGFTTNVSGSDANFTSDVTARSLKKENLLAKICIRQDLVLQEFIGALISMGDIGTRALMYYQDLEQRIALKRHIDHAVETTH
jgi:hypothetical protein